MPAWRAVRISDHSEDGSLSEGRDGAVDESTGRDVAGDGEEDHVFPGLVGHTKWFHLSRLQCSDMSTAGEPIVACSLLDI